MRNRGGGGGSEAMAGMDLCVERILQYAGLPSQKMAL